MKYLIVISAVFLVCHSAPIVKKKEETPKENTKDFEWQGKLSYEHYLTQVMNELETDKDFGERLKEMRKNASVKTEDLATQLTFVKHSVRTKLDELKRLELRRLAELERRLDQLKAIRGDKDVPEEVKRMVDRRHVDHENPSTFEIDDLQRLIKRAVSDIHNLDRRQREEFKQHEMEKEVLHRRKMKHIKDEKKKAEEQKKWEESQARHNKHPKMHTPGSEAQLKDVWEHDDKMDPNDFDARTFFNTHDLDGDGMLEEGEIESLFQSELDQAYDPNNPDDDMQERYESMMEMRENMMKKIDKNQDLRISFEELKDWMKSPEFKKDDGFRLPEEDKSKLFNDEDVKKFEQEYDREHPDEYVDDTVDHHDGEALKMNIPDHENVPKKDPGRKTEGKQVAGQL